MEQRQPGERFADLPSEQRAVVEAAAVLEQFDAAALAALLDAPIGNLAAYTTNEGPAAWLEQGEGGYCFAGEPQAILEMIPPQRLRDLYGRAAHHYAARLAAANPAERAGIESVYIRHLERRCEALIQQEPTQLAQEVAAVPLAVVTMPDHKQLLQFYHGLGEGLAERFAAAQSIFAQLLANQDIDATIRGRTLNAAAFFARHQGNYQLARDWYEESYTIWLRLNNPLRQGLTRNNQGIMYYELQEYELAETCLRSAAELFVAVGSAYHQALSYNELGLVYRDQGRWQEALDYLVQASHLWEQTGSSDALSIAIGNIGEVELLRGNFDAASERFVGAMAARSTRVHEVDDWLNLGLVSQAQGEDETALDYYQTALALAHEIERHDIVPMIHYRIGHALQRLGRLDEAQAGYTAGIAAIESRREPLRDEGLMISLMGRWQQVYEAAVLLCLERGDVAGAFDYAERARARAFADMLARDGDKLAQLRATPLTAHETLAALPSGALLLAYFATGLRGPESAMLQAIPREAAGLRACLETPARLLLFALTSDGLRAHTCALNPNLLLANSPYQADGRRFLNPSLLRRAHDALIEPIDDLLDQAERVVIVPHGPLHHLPFAALLDSAGRPLLERAPRLSYAPSATVWLRQTANDQRRLADHETSDRLSLLALGYDGGTERRLRHTELEATVVARMAGGAAWRGEPGVQQRLREIAGSYRWLHFACHGEFNLTDPLQSWLEIGPGERLSAAEVIAEFRLDAELVALSACRSGVSKVLRGDEPMGLVRAFLSAGARAVLVTLWPVEDASARLLMERFYQALQEMGTDGDPAAALQVAQQYLRGLRAAALSTDLAAPDLSPDSQPYADPGFWAAYVLIGSVIRN